MQYIQLGNSGLVVSRLTLGTMLFGKGDYFGMKYTIDLPTAKELVAESIDRGINIFDTADMYCNGLSETFLGEALGKRRQDVLITTKACFRGGEQVFNSGINYKHLIESCERSLKRLNTDYIDLYLLHGDDPITPISETLKAIENLTQRGLIRYAGFSNWLTWKAATALQIQHSLNYSPFITSQMHYSLLNRDIEHEFAPFLEHTGTGLMVWSPLSGGFLTGKYTRENPQPEDGRLNTFDLKLFDRE
jgi:aryl-alcohol dehydrogenase-like predicted oxidoreductase